MKYWLSLSFILISICSVCQVTFDLKKDFRARGDGKSDDTKYFLAAVQKINSLKRNVVLIIPKGNYLLRPQKENPNENAAPYSAVNILAFSNCSNITIKGEEGSRIIFAPGLYYGAFRRKGKGAEKLEGVTTDYRYFVAVGHGIFLDNCSGVTISSLEIDGANKSFVTGGQFGDVGFQIDNDGIFINNSTSIKLTNLNLHHFGRDGIQIINKTPQGFNTPSQKIELTNCRFEYNGRQGFSWTGGVGLVATNCSFSYTGKSKFSSPPGAGVDFEPNGGYVVKDGAFVNCIFKSNSGVGVLADAGGFSAVNVQFSKCLIQGETTTAVWIKSPAFVFTDCTINGSFYFGCPAHNAEEGTKFIRCSFSDHLSERATTNYLVESNESKYLLFDQCSFKASTKGILYIAADAGKPEQRAVLKDCRIISLHKSTPKAPAFTTGVDFTGRTIFIDSGKIRYGWNMENSRFIGVKNSDANISIASNYMLASYDAVVIGDNRKDAEVSILRDGFFSINNNAHLTIGEEGKLIIKKGGSLWIAPGAELIIKGKIIVEEGAYLCIHQDAKLSAESKRNITIKGKANFTDNPQMKFGLSGCITVQ